MKQELKLRAVVAPTETVIVSAYDGNGRADACTLAFYMVSSHLPPCVTIAINATQRRKTLKDIMESWTFVLGFPGVEQVREADYLGVESGYNADKLKNVGFTTTEARTVHAPVIDQLLLSLECEVVHTVTIGSHTQITGEVKNILADESILNGKGRCVCRDGLTPVLDAIRESDGLIIGSPNYLSEMTASFRALYERLIFQNLTYNVESPCCNPRPIPVLLIMTSNAPDTGYLGLLRNYQQTLSRFVGPTELLVSGNTLQLKNYSKTDWPWTLFNPEEKQHRHETIFPQECRKAYEMGAALAR